MHLPTCECKIRFIVSAGSFSVYCVCVCVCVYVCVCVCVQLKQMLCTLVKEQGQCVSLGCYGVFRVPRKGCRYLDVVCNLNPPPLFAINKCM